MAIQLGMSPIEAVSMATYNTSEHYGLRDRGAIAPGRSADLLLVSDLQTMQIESVYKSGVPAEILLKSPPNSMRIPETILHSVHLKPVTADDLRLPVDGITDAIGMVPGQILTNHLRQEVPAENGYFKPSVQYTKLCVLERHGKNGNIAIAPLKGYGIRDGAVATSVAHDSHNIIAAGDNDGDIALAINHIREINGGYAVASGGRIIGSLPLRVAGLMCDEAFIDTERRTHAILEAVRPLQIADGIEPFISLSFLALPVIPTLRLTDKGLIDLFSP